MKWQWIRSQGILLPLSFTRLSCGLTDPPYFELWIHDHFFHIHLSHRESVAMSLGKSAYTSVSSYTIQALIMESLAGAELPSANQHIIRAFNVIQLISAGGLTLILLTALISKRVKRHSTWYNFTVSWIFSCICYTLLCFAGQQVEEPPNHMLCTIQSALIYAAPVLWVSVNMFSKILVF